MTGRPYWPAAELPRRLSEETVTSPRSAASTAALVRALLMQRHRFGITRLGAVTGLDRLGLPVAQAVRPAARSNAVSQGKGLNIMAAAASALMECLESWAGEDVAAERQFEAPAGALGEPVRALWALALSRGIDPAWDRVPLRWIEGWDLLAGCARPVPAAMVDTDYRYPSPHPALFPRTTTGLAAGTSLHGAVIHGALEVLERDATARAGRLPGFFDRFALDPRAVAWPGSADLIARLSAAGCVIGIWAVPSPHGLPIYWCHVLEADGAGALAPLPGEGFGCDVTHDAALQKALLEACQARATAIAGAREDITRRHYPDSHDRDHLARWRRFIAHPAAPLRAPTEIEPPTDAAGMLKHLLRALEAAGAGAALVVPLVSLTEPAVEVVRLVAPGLHHGPHG